MENELLPCPFCGKKPHVNHEGGVNKVGDYDEHFYTRCCFVEVYAHTEKALIEKWNTRPQPATKPDAAEALAWLEAREWEFEENTTSNRVMKTIRAALQNQGVDTEDHIDLEAIKAWADGVLAAEQTPDIRGRSTEEELIIAARILKPIAAAPTPNAEGE